jgi:signal transduction histidine kinase
MKLTLRRRLILTFIGLTIIPLILVGGVLIQRSFAVQSAQALALQSQVAQTAATEIKAFIQAREDDLRLLSEVRSLANLEPDEQIRLLDGLLTRRSEYEELILLDNAGNELVYRQRLGTVSQNELGNRISSPEFAFPKVTGTTYYSPIEVNEFGEPFMTIALPLGDLRTEELSHVLVAKFRFKTVWDLVTAASVDDQTVYVVDRTGQVVAHPNPSVVLQGRQFTPPDGDSFILGLAGDEVAMAMDRVNLGDESLTVIAEQPQSVALSLALNAAYVTTAAIIIGLILAITLGFVAARRIVKPVDQLALTAQMIREGDLTVRAEVHSQDEIGALAGTFNQMADQINDLVQNLENRVAAQTRDLQLAGQVARQITTVLDINLLLPQLVEATKAAFNLYFVSVYVYRPETQQLTLAAGTGESGQRMLAEERAFHLDSRPSLVAKSGRERRNVIINDVSQEPAHAENPYLPDTQSEVVLPMLIGEQLIGVLGLQSEIKGRFGPDEVAIFTTLGEQIAIAVKNAQLYAGQTHLAEELRKADQAKSQFLASMSHELRTPLNAIMNFTEMVALEMMGPINPEQKDLLEQSLISSQHLLNLINDVLDISKIQAGMLSLFVEHDVNMYTELKTAVGMAEPMLKGKPVTLIQDIDDNLPLITGDKRRIRQIMLNLLSNAAKFTDEGSITLSAKNQGDHLLLAVIDSGPGIAAEMQSLIFEPFMQTADGVRHAQGTGLGLPITRSLVAAHGGQMWLESELGEGAAFYVTLPVGAADSAAIHTAVPTL